MNWDFLEFEKNLGWISAFDILNHGDYKIAIVVVREGLLKTCIGKMGMQAKITFHETAISNQRTYQLSC